MLGLAPTILAVVGPSIEETTVLSVVGRRPFLALCIAASSPAVFPVRAFDNQDPVRILGAHADRLRPPRLFRQHAGSVMFLEYCVIAAAIANIATTSQQLGTQAISSLAPQVTTLPPLYAFSVVFIHISGAITLGLRIRSQTRKFSNTVLGWFRIQFTPYKDQKPIKIKRFDETYWYNFMSWFTAVSTACHIVLGTITLSSLTFISVRDSIEVLARYFASVLVCRSVLVYELACLRDACNTGTHDGLDIPLVSLGPVNKFSGRVNTL